MWSLLYGDVSVMFSLLSAFVLYSITNYCESLQSSYDHYKCIVVNKNSLHICFPYAALSL